MGLFGGSPAKTAAKSTGLPARPTVFNELLPIRVDDAPAGQLAAEA